MVDAPKPLYRMNRLMSYTELEAFTAQKVAGSKGAYFALLDDFTKVAPGLLQSLAAPEDEDGLIVFLKHINELQKLLLAIGSSSILWEAEKVAEVARSGDKVKCAGSIVALVSRVKTLCSKLDNARYDAGAAATVACPVPGKGAGAPPAPGGAKPKAPIKSEPFEKAVLLIDNFEMDAALGMLQSLMEFSYNAEIDKALEDISRGVTQFDYALATEKSRQLLELAKAGKADPEKSGRRRILAIDDVPDVLSTVKAVLKNHYTVYGVTNHMAALKFLTSNSADLILLDIEMPDMNGFALLGIIRKIKAYEKTPVLFLTGSVSVENIKKAQEAGGNGFIKKPIETGVLLARIEKHLAGGQ